MRARAVTGRRVKVRALAVASIIAALIMAGAILGGVLRTRLAQHHLADDTKDMVQVGIRFLTMLSALVLGLIITSAKSSFDIKSEEVDTAAEKLSLLDHNLQQITNDSGLFKVLADAKAAGTNPALAIAKAGYKPDMKKRGSVRTVFDGRYEFSRYFSPLDHNNPVTIDDLYKWNDVELFDLQTDPDEMINLATNLTANRDLITAMSTKLETIIKTEIGKDDGHELPNIPFVDWTVDRIS